MSPNPRTIPFVKASACGNSFLLIDLLSIDGSMVNGSLAPAGITEFSRLICDPNEGVGADGVEWMFPHATADVEIRLINADGSEAEISGNGTRCVAAYLCAERGKDKISIQTGAGLKTCTLTAQLNSEYEFEIEMGEAVVGKELALSLAAAEVRTKIQGIPVSMGNPHYVVFVPAFAENWQREAAQIQRDPIFKQGINIELVVIENTHSVAALFFERGVGETQSSGTGSCASAIAAIATGKAESPVKVHAPGGTQTVRTEGKVVFLRGPARLVCHGEFFLD